MASQCDIVGIIVTHFNQTQVRVLPIHGEYSGYPCLQALPDGVIVFKVLL
jgi:hypothetical protein